MTVAELGDRMTTRELVEWQAFDAWRKKEEERAEWRAKAKAKRKGGRS